MPTYSGGVPTLKQRLQKRYVVEGDDLANAALTRIDALEAALREAIAEREERTGPKDVQVKRWRTLLGRK